MSPAHVLEPTYRRLKRGLMDGAWPNGAKLEAMRIADDFGVSMTPVRDSLNRLVGEGLVDLTPGEGFRVPVITEQDLRDILHVNAAVLGMATSRKWRLPDGTDPENSQDDYADRMAAALSALAAGSGNQFLADMVDQISDRLHHVRSREPQVLSNARSLLEQLEASLRGSGRERREALRHYHWQCHEKVTQLVTAIS